MEREELKKLLEFAKSFDKPRTLPIVNSGLALRAFHDAYHAKSVEIWIETYQMHGNGD